MSACGGVAATGTGANRGGFAGHIFTGILSSSGVVDLLRALIGEMVLTKTSSNVKLVLRRIGFLFAFSSSLRLSSKSVSYSHSFSRGFLPTWLGGAVLWAGVRFTGLGDGISAKALATSCALSLSAVAS